MGRGLSAHQMRILRTLAEHGETAVVELVDCFYPPWPQSVQEERKFLKARGENYHRNIAFACRRAIWNLARRGLVEETWFEVEWTRTMFNGRNMSRAETVSAARLTKAGEELVAGLPPEGGA